MNPQVLTTTKSAPSGSSTSAYPPAASFPSIVSESTRFFGHPSDTNA